MEVSIVTLTKNGVDLGIKIRAFYPEAKIYTLEKHYQEGLEIIKPSLREEIGALFQKEDLIIFIMATGIVVRMIAPFIEDKRIDPGIIVLDEKGEFVISLLSGHLGGGNKWARQVASWLGGTPVITTASDVNGKLAVDTMAELLSCSIENMEKAKNISVKIIEDRKIGIISKIDFNLDLGENFQIFTANPKLEDFKKDNIEGLIIISETRPTYDDFPYVWLLPRDLVIGIGCKRGKTKTDLRNMVEKYLAINNISLLRIKKFVTINIKSDEEGLLELSRELKIPVEFLEKKDIEKVADKFKGSDFVKKITGVKAVSEPCGYIGSNYGKCILPLIKEEGITLSIWEKNQEEF